MADGHVAGAAHLPTELRNKQSLDRVIADAREAIRTMNARWLGITASPKRKQIDYEFINTLLTN